MAPLLVVLGLVLLAVGAEAVVRAGARVARRFAVPPLVVGITIVSVGTSLPELAVGVDGALRGAGPLVVGNIVGTNIVNLLLILGLGAVLAPVLLDRTTLRRDLPAIVVVAVITALLLVDGELSRVDAIVLVILAVGYTGLVLRQRSGAVESEVDDAHGSPVRDVIVLVAGLAAVVGGAELLVSGAVELARLWGVDDDVIGLTVVAIGTSAPELVTLIVATIRGERGLALGNLIGSSVYNLALVLGASALVRPLAVSDPIVRFDLPVMVAVVLLLVPVFWSGRRISRTEGAGLVVAYLVYLGAVLVVRI
ncbi:calcium/sodium antiporter [Aeromicrobium sp. YIM 150415]|uniref:calcium/sodium antiporter n=1 Tax=Aeromicrobium sp. YIM 150415 TaxID=2803912 RepID=UPI0019668685|nr:calcium/sodium antiporter [Aeromicrobium sp. YIM 150415]MBM9462347.1 calcium/sodium antiporter [Aeromicrobium sp. YIM 150415]